MKKKENYTQKYYLKKICHLLYCFGLGNFWYEEIRRTNYQRQFYLIWTIISNSYIFLMILNEFLAYLRDDLTEKEKGDLMLFSFAHPSIAAKILLLYLKRREIQEVLHMLLESTIVDSQSSLEKYSIKRAKFFCICLFVNIYIILTSATVDGVKNYIDKGIPIRTEVTYIPSREESGLLVNVFRFLIQLHWWFIISIMYLIDCLSICSLVFLSYKFRKVRLHFEKSRVDMIEGFLSKTHSTMDSFEKNFITGTKLHQDALRCARKIQKSFGNLFAVEVVESISMLATCLLKFSNAVRNVTSVVNNLTFISCLILLIGTYMMSGGDVTYEASLISDSVFHCGWEYAKARRSVRSMVVVTIQSSQTPIRMTAFGVLSLSYNNLITVLRMSYSFFAVMY